MDVSREVEKTGVMAVFCPFISLSTTKENARVLKIAVEGTLVGLVPVTTGEPRQDGLDGVLVVITDGLSF